MKNTLKRLTDFRKNVYFYYYHNNKTLRINSGVLLTEKDLERNKLLLDKTESKIRKIIFDYQITNDNNLPDTDYLKSKLNYITNNNDDINSLYEIFYNEKIKELKEGTFNQWKTLGVKLKELNEENKIDINKINEEFIKTFQDFIFSKKIGDNTHRKLFIYLKAFIEYSLKNEYIKRYEINWKKFEIKTFDKEIETLSLQELRFLKEKRNTETDKLYKKILDVFLFSCYSGLRYSDLIRVNKSHFSKNQIIMNTLKTNIKVIISLNQTAIDILKENDFNFNYFRNSYFDIKLKELLKSYSDEMESFKENVILTKRINKTDISYNDFRYNFISAHTARRTYISILIDNNIALNKIMLSTGHKSLSVLNKYVNRKHDTETNLSNLLE